MAAAIPRPPLTSASESKNGEWSSVNWETTAHPAWEKPPPAPPSTSLRGTSPRPQRPPPGPIYLNPSPTSIVAELMDDGLADHLASMPSRDRCSPPRSGRSPARRPAGVSVLGDATTALAPASGGGSGPPSIAVAPHGALGSPPASAGTPTTLAHDRVRVQLRRRLDEV